MTSTDAPSLWRRARRHLQRPSTPLAYTRWLFFLISVVSLLLIVPGVVIGSDGTRIGLLAVATVLLLVSWIDRFRIRRVRLAHDVADAVAIFAFTLACPGPSVAFAVVFPALWFRGMYGRTWRAVTYAVSLGAALVVAGLVWDVVPGHLRMPALTPTLATLPVLVLTAVGARHLAQGMQEREDTRGRDAALRALGTSLLGVTDPGAIRTEGWRAVEAVAVRTPGLRVLAVADDGTDGDLRVVERTGDFVSPTTTLPRTLADAGTGPGRVADPAPLTAAAGFTGEWQRIPLPAFPGHTRMFPGAFMLVGAPRGVPADAVTALESLNTQVALAMRSSQAHRDLETQARTDTLTGLANRDAFTATLDHAATEGAERTWVLFLDLDDFKVVNDELGHAAGDQLLRHVAARMLGALREQDLCARLGGDEFGVLLRDAEPDVARRISQRLVELLSAPLTLEGRRTQVGASVGVALLRPGSSGAEAVQHADLAMYAAKAAGKNRAQLFTPELLAAAGASAFEAELRRAVERDEFVVHYQPIVSATDGRTVAVEALVRWDHPLRGLLTPAEFLDVAEHSGIVVPIGEQVLRQACAEAAGWPDDVALHVNASPLQVAHPHFLTVLRECLTSYDLGPERLIIEITESTVLDAPAVQATLDAVSQLGVGIAVDDFGTGYSALTTLRSLPVDVVKIDKSFVAGAATVDADRAVIEAIAQMAHRLGLQTVAEGVEDVEQLEFVRRTGITAVQGYLHQAPVPADELARWLAAPRTAVA